MLRQYSGKQPREALVQLSPAQCIHVRSTHGLGTYQTGIAQHAEMVRHARLRPTTIEITTTGLLNLGQPLHNLQPHWIAQGVEHALKAEVAYRRMFEGSHRYKSYRSLYL